MNKEIFNQLLNKRLIRYSLSKELNDFQKKVLSVSLAKWLLHKKNNTRFLFDFEQKGIVVYFSGLIIDDAKFAIEKFLRVEKIEYKLIIEMGVKDVR
tara:strand:- start:277 stop:567 length:291 start_codon:yes stop_codon:yes gene_type:complete